MIVACSGCSHRFEGGGYRDDNCPLCGAIAFKVGGCPRCTSPLWPKRIEELVVDECPQCRSIFLDHAVLERLVRERQERRISDFIAALASHTASSSPPARMVAASCPRCGTTMETRLSSTGAGVIVDVCNTHGVFFDIGELSKIMVFVDRERREGRTYSYGSERHATNRTNLDREALDPAARFIEDWYRSR